ncbi:MAG: right-handed parallel beta-helix repeat-containing protein [Ignavibacteria bacterium]|nr:right-handed parallel beta-helix repeat-containing protein [Ignavibacteria bacterium]
MKISNFDNKTYFKIKLIMNNFIRIAIFFLLLNVFNNSFANYSTPGSGKNWNLDSLVAFSGGNVTFSSPNYIFNDTIIISVSDTVKVLTNSVIKFASRVFVDIFGVLIVNPTDSAKITALDTNTKFLGLKFEDQSDGSILRNLIFEYGNAIRMLDCNILIDRCTIRFNTLNNSFASGAISFFRSNSVVSNCKIYRNRRAAITSGANIASSPTIENNLIYENDTENANVPQINFGATGVTPMIIRGNTIIGSPVMSGGISFLPAGTIPYVIIENNIIKKNRYGIAIAGSNSNFYINNNIIDSNNIQGSPTLGGSGINFNGGASQVSIVTRNIIRGNLWGITIQGTAKPNLGNLSNADTTDVGLNQIYNNGNSGKIFDLFNNTVDSIKAENNFWGYGSTDTAEAHIFHKADSTVLGFVDYIPLRSLKVKLKVLMESMYDAGLNQLNRNDTVKVYLRNITSPYNVIDSAISGINVTTFEGLYNFYNANPGKYYLQLRHFNTIETWSKTGGEILFSTLSELNYDMTNSASQVYGSNEILVGSKYCMFSGDADQNGIVDTSDISITDNDVYNALTGIRIITDYNADGIVDGFDLSVTDNNATASVTVISPLNP